MIKHFEANEVGRDFVVGDLHGCYELLVQALQAVNFDKDKDRLFSVGDLIDRGPDSQKCLSLLYQDWFHAVKGNHENILEIIVQEVGLWNWWISNGGAWAKDLPTYELEEYARRINRLPLAISVGRGTTRFNVIHAEFYGLDVDLDRGDYDARQQQALLWGRTIWNEEPRNGWHPGLSRTYCGHTISDGVRRNGSFINIDCGAFKQDGQFVIVDPNEPRVTFVRHSDVPDGSKVNEEHRNRIC